MRTYLKGFGVLTLIAGLLTAPFCQAGEVEQPQLAKDADAVVKGNSAFALALYAKLKAQEGNLFLSPYSISTALAMTYAGARGNTEAQMAEVLHFELEQDRLHQAFQKLISDLNAAGKKGGYQLSVANALWGQKGYGFLKEFLGLTRRYYGAGLNEVDFIRASEAARKTINAWVEKETRDKIKDLIKPGILDALTRLVLTNAIYFKGDWASKFKEEETKVEPFTLASGEKVDVPLMQQTEEFKYMQGEHVKGSFTGMVLAIPAIVSKTTQDVVQRALETVPVDKVRTWVKETFGKSARVKRKEAFSIGTNTEQKPDQLRLSA